MSENLHAEYGQIMLSKVYKCEYNPHRSVLLKGRSHETLCERDRMRLPARGIRNPAPGRLPGIGPGGTKAALQGACYGTGSGTVGNWTRDKPMRRTGAKAEDATSP